jgi:hypothetical protein
MIYLYKKLQISKLTFIKVPILQDYQEQEINEICTVASSGFWSSMSFQNLVRLSQIKKNSLPDYAHVNKVSKN